MEETIVDTISQENAHVHFPPQMSELCITEKITHPTTLSLFSGAGGLDIGFHKAGFKIIASPGPIDQKGKL